MDKTLVIFFITYLLFIMSFGVIAYRVTKNMSDFVLGGRSLSGPIAALSSGASDMSAWLLLGVPGAVYAFGLNQVWLPIGLTIGAYVNWQVVAKPLRVFTEFANDSLTVPAFLHNRFLGKNHAIRLVSAIATIIFFLIYISSGLLAGAKVLEASFSFDYHTSLFIASSIILLYTFIGGFLAVSWTDFFQGNFMLLCMLFIPLMISCELNGVSNVYNIVASSNANLLNPIYNISWIEIISLLAWGLGYFGQPHILVRFMSVKTTAEIPTAKKICMTWMVLSMMAAFLIGICARAYSFSELQSPVLDNRELVFIEFTKFLFTPALTGLVLAATISAIMCAVDSQMLASSSAIVEDLYHPLINKKASQQKLVSISRISIVLISIVAVWIASDRESFVIDLVQFAWSGLAASFAPAVLCSLFWRRLTSNGVVAGMLAGLFTVISWKLCSVYYLEFAIVNEIIPGLIVSFVAVAFISLSEREPEKDVLKQYDDAWKLINSSK